ncbi:pentraxin fusion protein-like [Acanthaster planci]|uniref:Pentraxin fusion protein-like n=1 Tax=Acanthaster planci TaxID=133434 RepID=A0A8B7YGQ2_ACAPL|nr:pentraxin fusion protein-like [Acanthaster planci]
MLRSLAAVVLMLGVLGFQMTTAWNEDELGQLLKRVLKEEVEETKKSIDSSNLPIVGKITWQSSTLSPYSSDKAVDGSSSSNLYSSEHCSHTIAAARDPWWMVDLGSNHCISKVRILNRGDCCSKRLKDAVVRVGPNVAATENWACGSPVTAAQAAPWGDTIEFICYPTLKGRYVSVDIPGSATLHLCEVALEEVPLGHCPDSQPFSVFGKPAEQSTTHAAGYAASFAVDGSSSAIMYPDRHCSSTVTNSNHPWWKVDLGGEQCVTKVTILNRGDCCSERLQNAIVRAGTYKTVAANQACGAPITARQAQPLGGTIEIKCDRPLRARYVSVDIPGTATLQLCEVSVEVLSSPDC